MFDAARHVPAAPLTWDAADAQAAIDEIVADATAALDDTRFWPAHPQDNGSGDGDTSLYMGAAGVIWALDHLARTGAMRHTTSLAHLREPLLDAARQHRTTMGDYGRHSSLHFGDFPALLVAMRLAPDAATADAIHARATDNNALPVRELMWGVPGSMLACLFMDALTGEARWRALFVTQAARLIGDLEETNLGPLWTQDLYGSHKRYLGPVHGFAGNMIPLLRGWAWLDERQRARVADAVPRTLAANAVQSELGVQWQPIAGLPDPLRLCQHCHGAPGMVTALADAPFSTPEFERLLLGGGELTWNAGPLAKGSNLCHGTGGNGYAFLKLYRRTHDPHWLERARAFAVTAIAQCREARAQHGRGRYSLWTGDVGLAVYLRDCIAGEPAFPTVDTF
jgi:Lanthionine synthetase C-like protein